MDRWLVTAAGAMAGAREMVPCFGAQSLALPPERLVPPSIPGAVVGHRSPEGIAWAGRGTLF